MEIEMHKMQRYGLDFDKTFPYFINHIKCGKTLSKVIIDKTDFLLGSFFTLLPENALIERLYEFSYGGIIPSSPHQNYAESIDKKVQFSNMISIDNELSKFIAKYLNQKVHNTAIFEDVIAKSDDPNLEFKNVNILIHKKEVYYLLTNKNSKEEIFKIIFKTGEVWHFLAVLFCKNITLTNSLTEIETDFFKDISKTANYIIVGAYDAEGYIFWERNTNGLITYEL